ncbi:hypothetical protein Tco_1157709 [Tanacetum coccineum]
MIWVATSKAFSTLLPFLSSRLLWNVFLSFRGCLTNLPLLLKNFLKSLTAMAYYSCSLPDSSPDSFLAFKVRDFLSTFALTILESFLMIISSDRGFKKRKTSKDAEPTKEEPEFEVADSDMLQNQKGNLGNDDEEPMREVSSKRDWFTKPKQPQEPTDPDWNVGKTPQQGPTQSWLMTLAATAVKPSKTFDELMSTPIDFSAYIMNDLNITNLTQETLLGPTFKLLKGTRTNFAELEYDFEECYKALSEKHDWNNPEGGDYPFDLTKPLPLVMNGNRQIVPVDYFFNNDLKYLQGGISTMTYTSSTNKTKAAQYARGLESSHDVYSTKRILAVTRVKEGDFPRLLINDIEDMLLLRVEDLQLGVESYQKKINITKPETTKPDIRKRDPYTPYQDPKGFIYVDNQGRNMLMSSDELYKFSDGTLTRPHSSLDDITKNI